MRLINIIFMLFKILHSLNAPKKNLFLNCTLNGETKNCFEDHFIKLASGRLLSLENSSSNLFQSQRSLKSQLKQKQSMLTIIFTGNREEAK